MTTTYTACISPDDTVLFFAQADTPEAAIERFIDDGGLDMYMEYYDIEQRDGLVIEAFCTLYEESWDEEMQHTAQTEGFEWFLGKKITQRVVKANTLP